MYLDWDVDRVGTSGWVHPAGMLGAMPMPDADGRGDLWRRGRIFNQPWLQRWATFTASQLGVSYRSGPLGVGRAERMAARLGRRICVGDRVPNLDCVRADGSPARLHAELGGEWALLVPASGDAAGPVARWGNQAAARRDGVEPARLTRTDGVPEAWLVRPDGHLAWRGTDPAAAAPWLAGVLQSGRAR